jgi:hypothetical protein
VVAAFWAFGLAFAVAMALGVFLWTGERRDMLTVLVTTMLAWIAVVVLAWGAIRRGSVGGLVPLAGAAGAVLTQLGCSIVAPSLRHPLLVVLTGFAGIVTCMVVAPPNYPNLFPLWQAAVAFCIGVGLGMPQGAAVAPAMAPSAPGPGPAAPPAQAAPPPAAPVTSPTAARPASPGAPEPAAAMPSASRKPTGSLLRRLLGTRSGF